MKNETKQFWLNIIKNILNVILIIGFIIVASVLANAVSLIFKNSFYVKTIIETIIYLVILLGIGSLYIKKVLKMNLTEIGLSFSSVKKIGRKNVFWIFFGLFIPCLVMAIYFLFIPGNFFVDKNANVSQVVVYAIFSTGLRAGIGEEFLFRGILFRYMKKTFGTVAAVIIPSVVFGLIHIMNMTEFNAIDVIQLVVGGTAVAVMFTLIAFKTDSLIPGMFLHCCWNIFFCGEIFGIGDIVNGSKNGAIIQYKLESSSHLLTGGNFGVEVALPAILVYILVSISIFILIKGTGRINKND